MGDNSPQLQADHTGDSRIVDVVRCNAGACHTPTCHELS